MKDIKETLARHPFVTPRFLQNPYMQVFASLVTPYKKTTYYKAERKFIKLPDGSQLAADCVFQPDRKMNSTIVIISGYEGYRSKKVSRLAEGTKAKAYLAGCNVIHLRQRGEGDTVTLAKKGLGFIWEDLPIAFKQFSEWGIDSIFIIGFSAGGYITLFTLGRLGKNIQVFVRGAVAISAPLATFEAWRHAEKNPIVDWHLLRTYKNLVKRRAKIDPPGTWDLKELASVKTKEQWVERYLPQWGFTESFSDITAMDKRLDAGILMQHISVPTLLIHAEDDPLTPITSFKQAAIQNNPSIITLFAKHGGHCGFITAKKLYGDLDRHWAENRAIEFIQLLDAKKSNI